MFKALTNYCLLFKRLLWFLNACFEGKLSELSIYLLRMFWFIIWTKPKMCTPVILYPTNTVSFFVFKLSWCFTNLKLFNMWNELILYRLKHITLLFTVYLRELQLNLCWLYTSLCWGPVHCKTKVHEDNKAFEILIRAYRHGWTWTSSHDTHVRGWNTGLISSTMKENKHWGQKYTKTYTYKSELVKNGSIYLCLRGLWPEWGF